MLPSEKNVAKKKRAAADELNVENRVNNFNEIEYSFSENEAISEAERCLNCAQCSECMECVSACEKKAVEHGMSEQKIELEVGAVILATGFDEYDAEKKGEYGFKRYTNVLTSYNLNACFLPQARTKAISYGRTMVKKPKEWPGFNVSDPVNRNPEMNIVHPFAVWLQPSKL